MARVRNCEQPERRSDPNKEQPMLSAAIDFWLLPTKLFFDAFLPPPKPASAIIIPLSPAAQRIRRKRKIVRSKRGN
jgi:hypothetical protein